MTTLATRDALTLAEAARIVREAMRDKTYQQLSMGQYATQYLRGRRHELTPATQRDYESSLDKLCRFFLDLDIADFEPPIGRERIEEFMDHQYGHLAPGTYRKQLAILSKFFDWHCIRENLHGNPTLGIGRPKKRGVYHEAFSPSDVRRIIVAQDDLRDRLCCRLLLDYGLRKGAVRAVQFRHFDAWRLRLTIFTKGGKVREIPIPDPAFWHELEQHILEVQARPDHFLLCLQKPIPRAGVRRFGDRPLGEHGAHDWWYRCQERAGVVPVGTTSGSRMHKARHTAGQRVLDATGNLKAVQMLLGHASIQTTGDVYADWDSAQLAGSLAKALGLEEEQ